MKTGTGEEEFASPGLIAAEKDQFSAEGKFVFAFPGKEREA